MYGSGTGPVRPCSGPALQFQKGRDGDQRKALQIEAAKRDPARFGRSMSGKFGDIFRFLAPPHGPGGRRRRPGPADLPGNAMLAPLRYRDQELRSGLALPASPSTRCACTGDPKGKVYMDLGLAETLQLMQDAELPNGEGGPEGWKRPWAGYGRPSRPRSRCATSTVCRSPRLGRVLGISEDAAKMRTHRVLGPCAHLWKGRHEGSTTASDARTMPSVPDDRTVSCYKDMGRLSVQLSEATRPLYERPLYRIPWAFLALLIIILPPSPVWEAVEEEQRRPSPGCTPAVEAPAREPRTGLSCAGPYPV